MVHEEKKKTKTLKESLFHLHQKNSNLSGYIDRVRETEEPEDRRTRERRDYRSSHGVRDIMGGGGSMEAEKPWWEI